MTLRSVAPSLQDARRSLPLPQIRRGALLLVLRVVDNLRPHNLGRDLELGLGEHDAGQVGGQSVEAGRDVSPVFAESMNEYMSFSSANCECFSALTARMWFRSVLLPTRVTYGMALPWKVRLTSRNQSSRFWKLW